MINDLPDSMKTKHGPMIAMPYSLDLDDGPLSAALGRSLPMSSTARDLDAGNGSNRGPQGELRVMVLPLHLVWISVPHRIELVREEILDLLLARGDTVSLNSGRIADWYAEVDRPRGEPQNSTCPLLARLYGGTFPKRIDATAWSPRCQGATAARRSHLKMM